MPESSFYQFKGKPLYISAGPVISNNSDGLGSQQISLSDFFAQIKKNQIAHVFALGNVLPYSPHKTGKPITFSSINPLDFDNYFIPDDNGTVNGDKNICSNFVRKIGRFTTYKVSHESYSFFVHHYPVCDGRNLAFSFPELCYALQISQQSIERNEKILSHCKEGKNRSGQLICIFMADIKRQSGSIEPEIISDLRSEVRSETGKRFVEQPQQEAYVLEVMQTLSTLPKQLVVIQNNDEQNIALEEYTNERAMYSYICNLMKLLKITPPSKTGPKNPDNKDQNSLFGLTEFYIQYSTSHDDEQRQSKLQNFCDHKLANNFQLSHTSKDDGIATLPTKQFLEKFQQQIIGIEWEVGYQSKTTGALRITDLRFIPLPMTVFKMLRQAVNGENPDLSVKSLWELGNKKYKALPKDCLAAWFAFFTGNKTCSTAKGFYTLFEEDKQPDIEQLSKNIKAFKNALMM